MDLYGARCLPCTLLTDFLWSCSCFPNPFCSERASSLRCGVVGGC